MITSWIYPLILTTRSTSYEPTDSEWFSTNAQNSPWHAETTAFSCNLVWIHHSEISEWRSLFHYR